MTLSPKGSFGSHHFKPESWNSFAISYLTCLAIMELAMSFHLEFQQIPIVCYANFFL